MYHQHWLDHACTHMWLAVSPSLLSYGSEGCRRTRLASLGGARVLLGGLKGMSGLGGSVRIGHQHSCCSLARLSTVTVVSLALPSLPAEPQQQCSIIVNVSDKMPSCSHGPSDAHSRDPHPQSRAFRENITPLKAHHS